MRKIQDVRVEYLKKRQNEALVQVLIKIGAAATLIIAGYLLPR